MQEINEVVPGDIFELIFKALCDDLNGLMNARCVSKGWLDGVDRVINWKNLLYFNTFASEEQLLSHEPWKQRYQFWADKKGKEIVKQWVELRKWLVNESESSCQECATFDLDPLYVAVDAFAKGLEGADKTLGLLLFIFPSHPLWRNSSLLDIVDADLLIIFAKCYPESIPLILLSKEESLLAKMEARVLGILSREPQFAAYILHNPHKCVTDKIDEFLRERLELASEKHLSLLQSQQVFPSVFQPPKIPVMPREDIEVGVTQGCYPCTIF